MTNTFTNRDRLTELDLRDNKLKNIENIHSLQAIEKLDLGLNEIKSLWCTRQLPHLQYLKLSNNLLDAFDVVSFPALRLLYLDVNRLSTITGLAQCPHLETLSLREQTQIFDRTRTYQLPQIDLDLSTVTALRKLYLSSNTLSSNVLSPKTILPNLQLLDVASCSLNELPPQFGTIFPNLVTLNLNFNALSDISGLEGISRLGRLTLVGNRICRLRQLCQVIHLVGGRHGSLTKLDLRGNPITVGFYPPPISGSGRIGGNTSYNLLTQAESRDRQLIKSGKQIVTLPTLGGCADIAVQGSNETDVLASRDDNVENDSSGGDLEISDPYTLPAANIEADQKYVLHLDDATRLKRRVVELMVQAAGSGRLKHLDGLPMENNGNGRIKKDGLWRRLEELGVLKKKT